MKLYMINNDISRVLHNLKDKQIYRQCFHNIIQFSDAKSTSCLN